MADAKDILGLPKATSLPAVGDKRSKAKDPTPKKLDKVSREVYALTGGLPPLVPSVDHKQRQLPSKKVQISWQWLPFLNSGRNDKLELFHWVRAEDGVVPTGDYLFAKYNISAGVIKYSDDEYSRHLVDPNWSRQETDLLFDLCEQFGLRFIIIGDRFTPSRTVEALKDRYYAVTEAVISSRRSPSEDVSDHPHTKYTYNMAYEVERKRALGLTLSRSRQQEREDAEVLAEARRITEARANAKNEERPSTNAAGTCVTSQAATRPLSPSGATVPSLPAAITPTGPRMPRVFMRRSSLTQMIQSLASSAGARVGKKIEQMLEELGVSLEPKVPSDAVCREHIELRKEVLALINLQKQVQWKETEVSLLRDNPYADVPPTPTTPKRSFRGDGPRNALVVSGKRENKRKAPARFSEGPPSPPQNKRARKLKSSLDS